MTFQVKLNPPDGFSLNSLNVFLELDAELNVSWLESR